MNKKWVVCITPVVFLALIFGFSIWNLLTPDKKQSETENRDLAQRPEFSLDALLSGKFTADIDTWLSDQFCWRDGFVGVKTTTEYAVGKRDTNGVYFGADGYLLQKIDTLDPQFEKNLPHFANFMSYAVEQLGTDHVRAMIVPTAEEILQDKLPAYATEFSQTEMLARMEAAAPEGTWVDLLEPLRAHKGEYIYYKTDHHWTTDGAWYGYRAYCDSLGLTGWSKEEFDRVTVSEEFFGTTYSKARLPGTQPDSVVAYYPKEEAAYTIDHNMGERVQEGLYDESWLEKKDKYSYFLGGNDALLRVTGPNKNGKSLLLIKDSYAHCMTPFLANEYETIYLVDLRYFNQSMKTFMEEHGDITDVLVLYNAVTFSQDLGALKMDKDIS